MAPSKTRGPCGEEVGRARGDSEADRPAPEAQPPTTKPWTDDDRALVDDMRRLARARRAQPDFLAMERARRARLGQAVDGDGDEQVL